MLPSKARVQARKILQTPRATANSAATVLSAEPVLHKNTTEESEKRTAQSSSPAARESAPVAPRNTLSTASYVSGQINGTAGDAQSGQYTYVTDDSGYTWLYDTIHSLYYYYDPAQGTYVLYDATGGAGLPDTAETAGSSTMPGVAGVTDGQPENSGKGKHPKKRRIVRMAGGQVWEDLSLDEWPEDDYRLFVGDLGPEVTTELLEQVFGKFRTMQRAHVVVDKKTGKSRGYGFLSFGDPDEFLAAWKQFNGKYVGSRPISLRKSSWKDRNVDIRKVKRQDNRAFLAYKHGK
ncbi:RNA-binding protein 42 [Coemansia sp. BCRC 34301]|nr:RNA-binding protein 42 [Coemansia sp. BCRC 34301]